MTVYITKYALTTGIIVVDNAIIFGSNNKSVKWQEADESCSFTNYAHGKDWHHTEDAAKTRAEEMRQAKIRSLERHIEKLKKLEF